MLFGEYIKNRRLSLGYSSTELANKVGCSASFITGIERGAQFPSTIMACKILYSLDLDYKELDPLTLKVDDTVFMFRSSLRGRNKEPKIAASNIELHNRIEILEARISSMEILVISLLTKRSTDG